MYQTLSHLGFDNCPMRLAPNGDLPSPLLQESFSSAVHNNERQYERALSGLRLAAGYAGGVDTFDCDHTNQIPSRSKSYLVPLYFKCLSWIIIKKLHAGMRCAPHCPHLTPHIASGMTYLRCSAC